jgi:hypothetical protein
MTANSVHGDDEAVAVGDDLRFGRNRSDTYRARCLDNPQPKNGPTPLRVGAIRACGSGDDEHHEQRAEGAHIHRYAGRGAWLTVTFQTAASSSQQTRHSGSNFVASFASRRPDVSPRTTREDHWPLRHFPV